MKAQTKKGKIALMDRIINILEEEHIEIKIKNVELLTLVFDYKDTNFMLSILRKASGVRIASAMGEINLEEKDILLDYVNSFNFSNTFIFMTIFENALLFLNATYIYDGMDIKKVLFGIFDEIILAYKHYRKIDNKKQQA